MKRPMVLPLPGNSTKEQSFYQQHTQPVMPGTEWPGSFETDPKIDQSTNGSPTSPDPKPFKLGR